MRLITSCTPSAVPISACTNRATACPAVCGERAVVARSLLPLADRVTTQIILYFVGDSTVFGETAGKRIRVLRLFGCQICSNGFGYDQSHRLLLGAIAKKKVSHHPDKIGSTHVN